MAHLCSIAVDFGKHGEKYVDSELLEEYRELLDEEGYPEFMEKGDKEVRESYNVLGLLYCQIKGIEDASLDSFKRYDYEKSILLQYDLDSEQVAYARANPSIFTLLDTVYTNIVRPMEQKLKRLVIDINICSEAEIFASNLQFKLF